MNLQYLINKARQYLSWLYTRQWERWELALAGVVILILLILIIRARQKAKANLRFYRERSPIIGIDTTGSGRKGRRIKRSQNNHRMPRIDKDRGTHRD